MTEPGWYNDAEDPSVARWHDGIGWTASTMRKADWAGPGSPPPPSTAPSASPTASPRAGSDGASAPWIESPPTARPRRQWERPSGHFIGALLAMVVAAVCLLILQRIDEDHDSKAQALATTTTLPSSTAEWQTVDGSRYRITVTPGAAASDQPSTNGCIPAAAAGRTNVPFTVRLENLSTDGPAPRPQVAFGVNVTSAGALDPSITTLDAASKVVEIGPVAPGTSCSLARSLAEGAGEPLAPGGFADFSGVVGGVPEPLPTGLSLIVRYFPADAAQVARGTGFTKVDLVVPFPVALART